MLTSVNSGKIFKHIFFINILCTVKAGGLQPPIGGSIVNEEAEIEKNLIKTRTIKTGRRVSIIAILLICTPCRHCSFFEVNIPKPISQLGH